MIRLQILALAAVAAVATAAAAIAKAPEEPLVTEAAAPPSAGAPDAEAAPPEDPIASALRRRLAALPAEGTAEEVKERAALTQFYEKRQAVPVWVTQEGPTAKARAIVEEIKKAADWGLDPADFALGPLADEDGPARYLDAGAVVDAEVALSLAILKYARHARGGRISDPTVLLNSNLDRKPQLLDPQAVIDGIAQADAPDAYLRGLHPRHPQFERLRQAYLSQRNKTTAKKILANMEAWRWMPEDLGELHILANVPEFMVHLVKGGETVYSERIVVGEVGKQTTIFTRPLKTIVLKPMWRVPESIKVRELWPSLRRGGGLFREHGLQLETKDGQPLDYRTIDWSTADIRDYEVVQPPGRRNVMGIVKFTFPSQHTIFMHDTIDKWMFAQATRTLSHGCLRLRNPMRLAELVLAEDKGWDAQRVNQMLNDGPANNEIVIDRKIPMHIVYFTAWVDDKGKLRTWRDVYGHERRITLALDGRWAEIDVGRDHLAPVEPVEPGTFSASARPARSRRNAEPSIVDLVGSALGGGF